MSTSVYAVNFFYELNIYTASLTFSKDIEDSLFGSLLKSEKKKTLFQKLISCNFGSKNKKEESVYTYERVGKMIEYLIDNYYGHKFTDAPFSKIERNKLLKILGETVNKLKWRSVS
jgi:hypothetical protein